MPHDPLVLLLHVGDAFAVMFRHAPGFEARRSAGSWYASSGEADCSLNWVGLTGSSAADVATLRHAVARLRQRRIEGLVCYPPVAETALTAVFRELGLGEPEDVPLMTCAAVDLPPLYASAIVVERMTSVAALAEAVAVVAAGFGIPVAQTARAFTADLLADPAVRTYAARRNGVVVGVLAGTRAGDEVSVDLMAVDPASQRQGIGRALMLAALHDLAAAGATGFHLLSSPEGKRLYDQVGFRTILLTRTRLVPVHPVHPVLPDAGIT